MDKNSTAARRQEEARELITSGHIWSAVWYLAWPTAINTLFQTAYNIINRAFIGHIPKSVGDIGDASAAVNIGGALLMVQFAVTLGLAIGTSALVSRFIGAREQENAIDATRQSIILGAIAGILTSLPLMIWAAPLVRAVGAQPSVVPLAANYLLIIAASSIGSFLFMIVTSALRSVGDVKSPLYAGAAIILINIVFDWFLILGAGPFPALGVHGAAVSTVISRMAGMAITIWYLHKSVLGASLRNMRVHYLWFGRIMRIGVPAMIQHLMWTSAYVGFIKVIGALPDATLAQGALGFALAIESTAFMPGAAYATAVTPLVGQNLGAGKPDRAEHSAWVATWQAVAIMSIVAIFFLVIPRQLARLLTDDETIIPLVASYLMINSISEPFLALGMVLRGALQGAGDVKVPAMIAALTLWIIRMPLAWLMAIHWGWGAEGAWWAMSLSTILSGVLTVIWFKFGRWRETEV